MSEDELIKEFYRWYHSTNPLGNRDLLLKGFKAGFTACTAINMSLIREQVCNCEPPNCCRYDSDDLPVD